MFGLIRKRKPIIHAQWYVPLLNFQSNAEEFYQAIEEDLQKREVPDMSIERIQFREAGMFSSDHEYLRIKRERSVVDVGSARFGTSWWFSARAASLPRRLTLGEVVFFVLALANFFFLYQYLFGWVIGSVVFGSTLFCLIASMWMARSYSGLDEFFMHMPVLGAIYEVAFRPETYHRQDQRHMFADLVQTIVRGKVKDFCQLGGVDEPDFRTVQAEQILHTKDLIKYGVTKMAEMH